MELLILYILSVILNLSLLFLKIVPSSFFYNLDSDAEIILTVSILLPGVTNIVTMIFIISIISDKIRRIYDY